MTAFMYTNFDGLTTMVIYSYLYMYCLFALLLLDIHLLQCCCLCLVNLSSFIITLPFVALWIRLQYVIM